MILKETFDTDKYRKIISKKVMDSDGFYTDYTMYYNPDEDNYFFIFGDEDVYGPDPDYADWTCETNEEATEWYNNYNGFEDDDLDECFTSYLKEGGTQSTDKYKKIMSKLVVGSDGFYTDYTMYYNPEEDNFFFILGDEDVYGPDPDHADRTCDTSEEATRWYNNYNGFEDDYDDYLDECFTSCLKEDINNVLPAEEIEIVAEAEPSKETVTAGPDAGIAGLINNLIIQNWDMNGAYTDLIVNADSNNQHNIANLAKDIVADINNHIGKLQAALAMLSPNVENIAAGESEAAQQLNVVNEALNEREKNTLERTGKISERIRRKLNSIVNRYNGWQEPAAIGKMFKELADEGVDVTVMGPPQDYAPGAKSWTVPWELDGVRVENSMFIYSVYEGGETPRNEYNMYFS